MSDSTDIVDYYAALAAQHEGKCVYHAPATEKEAAPLELSPAAQAVLNAYWDDTPLESGARCGLAAALRTAVEQVLPHEPLKGCDPAAWERDEIRVQLLAIASELESL